APPRRAAAISPRPGAPGTGTGHGGAPRLPPHAAGEQEAGGGENWDKSLHFEVATGLSTREVTVCGYRAGSFARVVCEQAWKSECHHGKSGLSFSLEINTA
uniref:Uncharacterized protein n=1 Tax=Cairina moschata TaxID=8855 RepID=A0A8C3CQR2_CAIMO